MKIFRMRPARPPFRLFSRAGGLGLAALTALALLGNHFAINVFYGVDLIFGSVATMIAAVLLGPLAALTTALAAGSYTFFLWGHPYALLIFALEGLAVALLYRGGLRNLVIADMVYWAAIGGPLVLLFYGGVLGLDGEAVAQIALKQPINGLFNALLAGCILLALQVGRAWFRAEDRLGPPTLGALLFHALLGAIMLSGAAPIIYDNRTLRAEEELALAQRLSLIGATLSEDLSGTAAALRTGLQARLDRLAGGVGVRVAVLRRDGTFLLGDRELAARLESTPAEAAEVEGLSFHPGQAQSRMVRWRNGLYLLDGAQPPAADGARLMIAAPAEPLAARMDAAAVQLFLIMAGLIMLGLAVAAALSRWLAQPLARLQQASADIGNQVSEGRRPTLPGSPIFEYGALAETLRDVSGRLSSSFGDLRAVRATLEQEVERRTRDLNDFKDVLDRTLDCVFMFDGETLRFTYMNEGARRQVGYDDAELRAMRPFDLKPLMDKEAFLALIEPLRSGRRESVLFETVHRSKTGRETPVEVFLQYVASAGAGGGGSGRFVSVVRDVSERKRSDEQFREQAETISIILNNMMDGVVTVDRNGVLIAINKAARTMLGYEEDEVLGRDVGLFFADPRDAGNFRRLSAIQEAAAPAPVDSQHEVETLTKDGRRVPIELAISSATRGGRPIFIGAMRDITERKRVERLKNEFISTVSHELRTPLTAISGALGLIAGGAVGAVPDKALEMVAIAQSNSRRLKHLINDLLDIEKLAAGQMRFDMKRCSLRALIDEALAANGGIGAEQGVALVLDGEIADVSIFVDAHRFAQILSNLISNAVKFSPPEGAVEISTERRGARVRVNITDHGTGVPPSFRDRIFEKFAQADASDSRKRGGSGLGLAITRELVERMGGSVDFVSVEGRGARFFVELPWIAEGAQGDADAPTPDWDADASRILVVEDDVDAAVVLELILRRAGYKVDVAYSGKEALHCAERRPYDLISVDVGLPDMSGVDVIRRIRHGGLNATVPILVVSAEMSDGRLALNAPEGPIEWLAKPFDESRLLQAVAREVRASDGPRLKVLHVEDDLDMQRLVRTALSRIADCSAAGSLAEARRLLVADAFQLVVLDLRLPDGSGWDLLEDLRRDHPTARVIVLSAADLGPEDRARVEKALLKSKWTPHAMLQAVDLNAAPRKSDQEDPV
ncbi:MAG: PAS domain S-box protein [Marivibrio sp.]|uniref:PAS domain S-box protein n=1 Tax=Marivibrio sp. TaxID=2039719 RepID=UPI0032EDE0DA